MLLTADQRRENIIALIKKEGKVRVSELSKLYNISEVTIRTDLEHLESTGSITRIHGGAIGSAALSASELCGAGHGGLPLSADGPGSGGGGRRF